VEILNDNKMVKNDNKMVIPINELICKCGKIYKFQSGLSRHKKVCNFKETGHNIVLSDEIEQLESYKEQLDKVTEMFKQSLETNKELQEKLYEVAKQPKTINNQTFNLDKFLNIECKDAINLTDFVESLKITFTDLLYLGTNGFVQSIQNTFVKELKGMEQTKRPIHCTDKKRKVLYVKDKNKWDKDPQHIKLLESVNTLNKKQYKTLCDWFKQNPNWSNNQQTQINCLEIMSKINGLDDELGDKNTKKVLNKIIENTILQTKN